MSNVQSIQIVLRCAFCFRDSHAVPKLIMGSFVGICSDCIAECFCHVGDELAALIVERHKAAKEQALGPDEGEGREGG